jgi:hypothetical protein
MVVLESYKSLEACKALKACRSELIWWVIKKLIGLNLKFLGTNGKAMVNYSIKESETINKEKQ